MALVEWLGRATSSADALGGKGASLDRLARFGFRIPPGFCLTTEAFREQVAAIPAVAGGATLGELLASRPLIPAIDRELREALREIDAGARTRSGSPARLAVRSSAIGEDGSAASYAGLHETELDRTIDQVAGAVARCWASLWSPAALAYRARRSLPLDGAAMAVVVQELVPADASAVAFTRHPVTGREDQVVLTTAGGLGDAMVSGEVTPDTFVVDKATRSIVERTPGDDLGRSVSDDELDALVALVLEVEGRFGSAVDVEAAISAGSWFLLQARPITTGATAPAAPAPSPLAVPTA
jgi:rifampicin phosphotransferase